MSDTDELIERARARVGQTLAGKYRVDDVIGVGGMAVVYVATHRNARRVAVKMLHPEFSLRADLRKRFLLEGRAANAVGHPGAVAVLDDDTAEDGSVFLVMELLEGQSVEELWQANGGALGPATVLAIGRELCDVLHAAHSAGIIHRDIKPANLFLTTDGRIKVLDFGLARVRDGTNGQATATGLVFGTPAFLPPEQAAGRTSHIDARTDVWAVGATLFTLLTGRTVHEGESAANLAFLAATTPSRSLQTVLPDAPPDLIDVVDRALAFERDDRWSSARAMREAIEAASERIVGTSTPRILESSDVIDVMVTAPEIGTRRKRVEVLGTRTSSPVSSTAKTEPQVEGLRGRSRRLFRAAAASFPMSTLAWRTRASLAVLAGVVLALLAVVGATRLFGAHEDDRPARSLPAPVAEDAGQVRVDESDHPSLVTSSEPASSSTAPAVGSKAHVPASKSMNPSRPSTRPVPRATVLSSVQRPNCSAPSYVDANGKTIWRPECL